MTGVPVPTLTDVSRHFVLGGGFLGLGAPRIVKAVDVVLQDVQPELARSPGS
jgi:hypothetical protein